MLLHDVLIVILVVDTVQLVGNVGSHYTLFMVPPQMCFISHDGNY